MAFSRIGTARGQRLVAGAPPEPTKPIAQLETPDAHKWGTTGIVVRDRQGNIAAGTTTGGVQGKRWGRVGDSPIIGAGTYASNESCGVSATGSGEYFIRLTVARTICSNFSGRRVRPPRVSKCTLTLSPVRTAIMLSGSRYQVSSRPSREIPI